MLLTAIIHKDEDSSYGVTVPDLPGCFSAGDTLDEALQNTSEAVELYLEAVLEDEDIPMPVIRGMEAHKANDQYSDAFAWSFIDYDISRMLENKARRFNMTMKELVLSKVDRRAQELKMDRSEYLAFAAIKEMTEQQGKQVA